MTLFKKVTSGLVAGAALLTVASPAEAQWRRRGGGDRAAIALGAAVASGNRWDRGWRGDRWDRGWNGGGRWNRWDGGWRGRGAWDDPRWGGGWGDPRFGGGWRGRGRTQCWRERVWDDWSGRWRRVRVCDRF